MPNKARIADGRPRSQAERFAMRDEAIREAALGLLSKEGIERLTSHWDWWQRPDQMPPPDPWRVWLVMAGRGYGKTRVGAEWVRRVAETDRDARIALVGATMADVRRVMVEGESGLLAIASDKFRPTFEPSLGRLSWPGGARAYLYSAAEPEALRGPEHSHGWTDEIAKWANAIETWDNLSMTMRLRGPPKIVATTTPRPVPLMRRLMAVSEGVIVTRGATHDNRAHLAADFLAAMETHYAGTRLGRQELEGELIDDVAGALWSRAMIEGARVKSAPPFVRVVVGVDPPAGGQSGEGDACGIVALGLGRDARAYVIEDASLAGVSPEGWARAVAGCAARHRADRVVAEANQGGEMVRSVLIAADAGLPVRLVHASRGKSARAEPVAALYEAGRAFHVGAFPALEDELCGLIAGGGYEGPGRSPDRADALVWAMSEAMLGRRGTAGLRFV